MRYKYYIAFVVIAILALGVKTQIKTQKNYEDVKSRYDSLNSVYTTMDNKYGELLGKDMSDLLINKYSSETEGTGLLSTGVYVYIPAIACGSCAEKIMSSVAMMNKIDFRVIFSKEIPQLNRKVFIKNYNLKGKTYVDEDKKFLDKIEGNIKLYLPYAMLVINSKIVSIQFINTKNVEKVISYCNNYSDAVKTNKI